MRLFALWNFPRSSLLLNPVACAHVKGLEAKSTLPFVEPLVLHTLVFPTLSSPGQYWYGYCCQPVIRLLPSSYYSWRSSALRLSLPEPSANLPSVAKAQELPNQATKP